MSSTPEGATSNPGQNMLEHPAIGVREVDDGDVSPAKSGQCWELGRVVRGRPTFVYQS